MFMSLSAHKHFWENVLKLMYHSIMKFLQNPSDPEAHHVDASPDPAWGMENYAAPTLFLQRL
jgi:hypothetical protein